MGARSTSAELLRHMTRTRIARRLSQRRESRHKGLARLVFSAMGRAKPSTWRPPPFSHPEPPLRALALAVWEPSTLRPNDRSGSYGESTVHRYREPLDRGLHVISVGIPAPQLRRWPYSLLPQHGSAPGVVQGMAAPCRQVGVALSWSRPRRSSLSFRHEGIGESGSKSGIQRVARSRVYRYSLDASNLRPAGAMPRHRYVVTASPSGISSFGLAGGGQRSAAYRAVRCSAKVAPTRSP